MKLKLTQWAILAPYVVVAISGIIILGKHLSKVPASTKRPQVEAIQRGPLPTPDELTLQGINLFLAKRYKKAILKFSASIAKNPNSAIAYAHSAHAHVKLKKYPKAITLAWKALALNPHEWSCPVKTGPSSRYVFVPSPA